MKQANMERERAGLEAIKAKMSESQRKDMAELLANELRSRAQAKRTGTGDEAANAAANSSVRNSRVSTPLNRDQVRELYQSVNKRLTEKRTGQSPKTTKQQSALPDNVPLPAGESMRDTVRDVVKMSQRGGLRFPSGNSMLMLGIAIFGGLKILLSTGIVAAAIEPRQRTEQKAEQAANGITDSVGNSALAPTPNTNQPLAPKLEAVMPVAKDSLGTTTAPAVPVGSAMTSPTDRALLTELESRRVELEKRRVELEHRAEELSMQEREMSTRLAELRTLTRQLADHRVEKDQGREARIEQLANVYGAMAPQEAAPLISKLDEDISLDLLQRLPGKRMAQILSAMDQSRAVEVTKRLSERAVTTDLKQ